MKPYLFKAVNIIVFFIALVLMSAMQPRETLLLPEDDVVVIHADIALPTMTLTREMKAGMFLERLKIDTSLIRRREIVKCVSPWEKHIVKYSTVYNIDPDLVRAIIYAESKGDPFVISHDGAQGLMQIMPETADFMGISNPLDPEENIKAGVKYITWLLKNKSRYDDTHLLWAWNAGPGKTDRRILPNETQNFIIQVLSAKTLLKEQNNNTS